MVDGGGGLIHSGKGRGQCSGVVTGCAVRAQDLGDGEARDDGATHCAATATKYSYPCARNALEISRVQDDGFAEDDSTLHYGQTVRFATTALLGEPLYLHSYHYTPTTCSKYSRNQEVTLSSVPEQYTLWKVLHVNPQERLQSEGTPVPINTAIVISHICTNQLLAATKVPYSNDFQIEHGDTEMCVKTFAPISKCAMGRRDHELEGQENHFVRTPSPVCRSVLPRPRGVGD
jgi:hypothetical protein